MIETRIVGETQTIVHHRVSGRLREDEALAGVDEAIATIDTLIKKQCAFSLLLDMRGYLFDGLASHRIWAKGFKEHALVKGHAKRAAVVGDNSPSFQAEKELLESDTLRFFYEPDAARKWLEGA